MIVDIFNEVFTNLKTTLADITVLPSYPSTTPVFPCVLLEEMDNISNLTTIDSSGENYNDISFEVNIYTTGTNKRTESTTIRKQVDSIMSDEYHMTRNSSGATPNFMDTESYRYTLRYSFTIDENKKVYRR